MGEGLRAEGLGENVCGHVGCAQVFHSDDVALDDLAEEVVAQVEVLSFAAVAGLGDHLDGGLVVLVEGGGVGLRVAQFIEEVASPHDLLAS